MDVSWLTPMNKALLDVACESLDPKLFPQNLCSNTKFVMIRKYPIEVRENPWIVTGRIWPFVVSYKPLTIVHYIIDEK